MSWKAYLTDSSVSTFETLRIHGIKPTAKELGRGSYGKVTEVTWNGTRCAAKEIHEIFLEGVSPEEKRRAIEIFQREIQTWASLRHPNIVILLGLFFADDDAAPQVILEKLDTTLRLFLEKNAKDTFSLRYKVDVLKQVAQGLCYLHNQTPPLVHHDLSTNNILINEDSFVAKLTDFGMTRTIDRAKLTRMSSIKGTTTFMAPEALDMIPKYDDKLDVFSFGNVIISTVTHQWPSLYNPTRYEGDKLVALTEYQRREDNVSGFTADEKKLFLELLQRCLENRPDRRPTSDELVSAMDIAMKKFSPQPKPFYVQIHDLQVSNKDLATRLKDLEERQLVLQNEHQIPLGQTSQLAESNVPIIDKTKCLDTAALAHVHSSIDTDMKCIKSVEISVFPNCTAQLELVRPLLKSRLRKDDLWCLVDVQWMKQWKKYVGFDLGDRANIGTDSAKPGPLDNKDLLLGPGDDLLKDQLLEDLNYTLIPTAAWDKLISWYGIAEDSRPIARKVIEWGMYVKHLKVEVYPIRLDLAVHPLDTGRTVTKTFSRADMMSVVKEVIKQEFEIPEDKTTRLWHRYMTNSYEQVKDDDMLQESGIYTGQLMFVELKNTDGTWPRDTFSQGTMNTVRSSDTGGASGSSYYTRSSSGGSSSSWMGNSYGKGQASEPGLCGLQNLGNTCFMNSALQCLSNTEQLTDYFRSKSYLKHINKKNPLGMGGQLADAYGGLLTEMWEDKCSYTAPRGLKGVIGKHAPQFVGYAQHDSQELLAFFLDGLHEDLNQIIKKPYVDMSITNEGRSDQEIAKETWEKYLLRNRSAIVNLFQGQLKSTLVCPDCKKLSRVFDPFMYLSLPLPIEKSRWLPVFLVRLDPKATIEKYKLKLSKAGRISDLQDELGKMSGVDPAKMVTIDLYQHRFHRIYQRKEGLNHILDRDDIFVYEVPITNAEDPEWVVLPVYHREQYTKTYSYSYSGGSYTQTYTRLFGLPLLVTVPRQTTTYPVLYEAVLGQCTQYVKRPQDVKTIDADNKDMDADQKEDLPPPYDEVDKTDSGEAPSVDMATTQNSMETDDVKEQQGSDTKEQQGSDTKEQQGSDTAKKTEKSAEGDNKHESSVDEEQAEQGHEENVEVEEKETEKEKAEEEAGEPRMFDILAVNAYGSQTIVKFKNDGEPLKLGGNVYIGCDWDQNWKEKCYDEDLSLETKDHESMHASVEQQKKRISINDCIELFTTAELLGEEDLWYCPHCKDLKQATKKFDLWKLPEILVVHLKRFSYNRYWRDKIDAFVDVPMEIDLSSFVVNEDHPSCSYELYAVTNHYGGMGGGHYTAFATNYENGKWYNYDDSHVTQTDDSHVVTNAAYVLFFRRKDTRALRKSMSMDQSGEGSQWKEGEDEPDEVMESAQGGEGTNKEGESMEE